MNRRLCLVWVVLVVLPSLAANGDTLDTIRQRGQLIWGADAEGGGPYVYADDADPTQRRGFEVDIAALLAKRLGVQAQLHEGLWDKLPGLLTRGDVDIVLNGYEWAPQLAERYATTIPYYVYELQFLSRRNDDRLRTPGDLRGAAGERMRVGVLGGSASETYLRQHFPGVEAVRFEGNTEAMRATELGGLDATLQDLPIATFYERRFGQLRRLGEPVSAGFYVVLVRREDPRLLKALNQGLIESLQDGSLAEILKRYDLWNATQSRRGLMLDERGEFRPEVPSARVTTVEEPGRSASREVLLSRTPLLVKAAGITVALSVVSMPLAVAIGLAVALGRLYGPAFVRAPLAWYVELLRGTPLVLQLFVLYFLLPELGIKLPPFVAAVIGLAINYSAYEAEIYRAGIQAIPRGQMEAALSLGMSRWLALRRIVVPQAVRLVIPPVTNDFIALFKDTAVCSVISVTELSKEYAIHAHSTGAVVELGAVTALLYLAMSYPLSLVIARMEKRLATERHT